MKKFLLLCLMTLLASVTWAQETFTYQDVVYNILDETTCEVGDNAFAKGRTEILEGEIVIPDTAYDENGNAYSVVGIGYHAFQACRNITSVVIPNSATYIGEGAFYSCAFTSVVIPESVTYIGVEAFYEAFLTEVEVPSSVKTIDKNAFNAARYITKLILNDGLVTIGDYAFMSCAGLTEFTIPSTVESMGEQVFQQMEGLEEMTILAPLTEIPRHSFANCYALETINIPESVETIGQGTFKQCRALKNITLPEGLKRIEGEEAERATLGSSVAYGAFVECTSLESIKIPDNVTFLGEGIFSGCTSLKEAVIGNSIETIRDDTFLDCTSLETVTIGNSVKEIYLGAFEGCSSLKEITLPESVEYIEHAAFLNCSSLAKVYSLNPEPPEMEEDQDESNSTFAGIAEDCVLYVPDGSKEEYASAYIWEDFYDIVEMIEFAITTLEATNVTDSSATLNGTVTAAYDNPIIEKGFEYWTGDSEIVTVEAEEDEMSVTVTGLESGITYFYRAYAKTEKGEEYGEELSFTTEVPEGISSIYVDNENVEGIYSTSGQKLDTTVKGVNIIRHTDGTTKKVLVK